VTGNYFSQQYGYYPVAYVPAQYSPQWVELIVPVVVGMMFMVVLFSMIRDLFKGREVKLPFQRGD
jgi:TRAP-type C4-dicarboxylate transport system permease small subunit